MDTANLIIQKLTAMPYVAGFLSWVAFGLATGVAAKLILPGEEKLGWIRTIFVGIAGAFLGGLAANYFGVHVRLGWNPIAFVAAIVGALVLLMINRVVTRS